MIIFFGAYLFLGTDGIGKKMIAKEFAKGILCIDTKDDACNCKSCACFSGGNHPDFIMINETGDNIKIEQIREITSKVIEKPIVSKRKVYIINDADKMSKEAQNCLLKTLEEPPEFITIILISSNENLILNTIKSRCMQIKFKDIPDDLLKKFATEIIKYENLTENLLKSFGGSIGKAISLKEASEKYVGIEKLINDMNKMDIIDVMLGAKEIYDKDNIDDILEYMTVCIFNIAKENRKYLKCIDYVNECKTKLKAYANFDMSIDTMLFNMWKEVA